MRTLTYPSVGPIIDGILLVGGGRTGSPVVNPATGAELGRLTHATDADVLRALDIARDAGPAWAAVSPTARSRLLSAAADLIEQRRAAIAQIIVAEMGKPASQALAEADMTAHLFRFAAEESKRAHGRVIAAGPATVSVHTQVEPIGPVFAISGWNAPGITPARKLSSALAAGCPVVLKASEATPATASFLVNLLHEVGVPAGVVNLLFGDPAGIARTAIGSPAIKMVTFTGSVPVGRRLGALAGERLQRMVLELGGHAPVLVFPDVDVDAVARAAVAARYRGAGQICTSPSRFYVHESVFDRFRDVFIEAASQLVVGDPADPETQMGPLASEQRVSLMQGFCDDAVAQGARLELGGQRIGTQGAFFAPTVFTNVPVHAKVASEEPFGPIAQLAAFATENQAINLASSLPVGLNAYVFSNDPSVLDRTAAQLNAGNVSLNHWTVSYPETPFGGFGDSGVGKEGGVEGIGAFQRVKVVTRLHG